MVKSLLETMRGTQSGDVGVQHVIDAVAMEPEQREFVGMLLSMAEDMSVEDYDEDELVDSTHADGTSAAQSELEDLRTVNDTLAAALGACAYCWGGDEECGACRGHGSTGELELDLKLFDELIAPAVARVAALRSRRGGQRGRRRHGISRNRAETRNR